MTHPEDDVARAVGRYRNLLGLFPRAYRSRVIVEWCQVFQDEYEDIRRAQRRFGIAALWVRTLLDVAVTLPGAWRSARSASFEHRRFASWLSEVRIVSRNLARKPGYTVGVAMTLGLGIGATTTTYSVIDGVILKPLPYEQSSRLAAVGTYDRSSESVTAHGTLQTLTRMSVPNFMDYLERTRSFVELGGLEPAYVPLPDAGDGPEMLAAARVTTEMFEILSVPPALGRTFLPEEYRAGSEAAVMITYGAWLRRFGGDRTIVGKPFAPARVEMTIVGVLPRHFRLPEAFFPATEQPELLLPLQSDHRRYEDRGSGRIHIIGRLEDGVTLTQARVEADQIAADLATAFPETNVRQDGFRLGIGVNALHAQTVGSHGSSLGIFLAAALLLLALATMNAATLLLARSLDRTREFGLRMALGAGRAQVLRLFLTEAILLSIVAGMIGLLLTQGGIAAFHHYAPPSIPRLQSVNVDLRVLIVASIISLGTGLVAGLGPALRLTGWPTSNNFSQKTNAIVDSRTALRHVLIGGQIAVAVVLLAGAGLLFGSFMRIRSADPGFEPEGLITMRLDIEGFARTTPGRFTSVWGAWDIGLNELASVPGVESVGGATNLPFQTPTRAPRLLLPGDGDDALREGIAAFGITPGYLRMIGTELVRGRGLAALDGPTAEPVVLVNESFVRTQLDGTDPINLPVRYQNGDSLLTARVVGVVGDVIQARAEDGPKPAVYLPYRQDGWPVLYAVIRTRLPAETIVPELRRAAARFNPIVPVQEVGTMLDRMEATRTTPRFQTMLISGFAFLALFLAATGLYGTVAHTVGRQRRELGLRMALGAAPTAIRLMVIAHGMRLSLPGLVVGLAMATAITQILSDSLYGVEPNDAGTLLLVALGLLIVTIAACVVPARRATTVDPVAILNSP